MFVTVKLFGTLRRLSQPDTPGLWQGEIPSGSTLQDLINRLGAPDSEVSAAAINGQGVPLDTPIPAQSIVMLVTNVNGG